MSRYPFKHYEFPIAQAIGDQICLLMAPHLPGCTPRRFDTVTPLVSFWPIELWLVAKGPIVPKILVATSNTLVTFWAYYGLMFRNRLDFATTEIYDSKIPQYFFLEDGAEVIAEAAVQGLANFDFGDFVARGTPGGVLKSRTRRNFALISLQLAQCALYAGQDDEAADLLRDTIRYAADDSSNSYARFAAEARSYLSRLKSDAQGIRKELALQVDDSWSHFSIATS